MKLRNKKTGEIVKLAGSTVHDGRVFFELEDEIGIFKREINSLNELNADWEDYEEPKEYWFIDYDGGIIPFSARKETATDKMMKSIGNYFDTREEAEKAVEKLKAWKLLKDECDIKFDGIIRDDRAHLKGVKLSYDRHEVTFERMRECMDALHLLFGVEEKCL